MITQPIKYHGGKHYLAAWLHGLAPSSYVHRVHVFAGGLGEFWTWPHEDVSEVVNDVYGHVANFYWVLRDPVLFAKFERLASVQPLSQEDWEAARQALPDGEPERPDVDAAFAFFVAVRMSRQGLMRDFATLSRNRTRRGMNEQASAWLSAVDGLRDVHERLSRVAIIRDDFERVIQQQDGPHTLFYCDPPYLAETRVTIGDYAREFSAADHEGRECYRRYCKAQGRPCRFMRERD